MTSGKTLIKWHSAFYSAENSVGKETPAYLGDKSLPTHLQLMAMTYLFVLIVSLLLELLIGAFRVLDFYCGGVCI